MLSPVEEQSLVQWILDLDRRGFPPQIINVRQMANVLLAARGEDPPPKPVGKCWTTRFINRQAELQTKLDRKLHSQRALCQDPVKFNGLLSSERRHHQRKKLTARGAGLQRRLIQLLSLSSRLDYFVTALVVNRRALQAKP